MERKTEERMAFRGRCPHGKVLFIAADDPDMKRDNDKEIMLMMRAGFIVDRIPAKDAGRSYDGECKECHPEMRDASGTSTRR